ncbi:pentapeptide repeat-containing protein [Streptomyces tanashiensis]|uniref:pentapeptide repeat-containing protein n=1 Tax=Streptomyces tanashiensis TaxID=67367 RepID=UPI0036E51847
MVDPLRPDWPHCGHGADPTTNPVGCRGVHVPGHTACLVHLTDSDRATYLAELGPGASIDHSGTILDKPLLRSLLDACRDTDTEECRLGTATFDGATFIGDALFDWVNFTDDASFLGATFTGNAWFDWATFTGNAQFNAATFTANASFQGTTFTGEGVWFKSVRFERISHFGPLVCQEKIDLSGTFFEAPVTVEIAAPEVSCVRTRWESTATLRLRYATVDLDAAVLSSLVAVTAHPAPFTIDFLGLAVEVDENTVARFTDGDSGVRIASVTGVDAAHLVLTDTDLTDCRFTGAFRLDQLRLEGNCKFAEPPKRQRWTQRRVLAEEHHWRALTTRDPAPPRGWTRGPHHPDRSLTPGPKQLAPAYRALRKATEDAKNEPDAADFYYGEMEMRRHDRDRPWGERALLSLYWAISGYGLRASRALTGLLVAMGLTVVLLMMVGLPAQPAVQRITGTVTGGQTVALTTRAPAPRGTPPGAWVDRFSWRRAERAARTAVNSVVFRSAGQGLTLPGTYIEMASRVAEPVLLALVLLALRGRVKR